VSPSATGTASAPASTITPRSRFVHDGFVASAPWYDPLTRAFSFGLDARWRRACLARGALRPGQAVLDVATGTGELVMEARRVVGAGGLVVGIDFCRAMLEEAQRKAGRRDGSRVAWVQGRAEALPFATATFDCVVLGFALRHVDDLQGTLREMVRVLRPGGRLVVLEWTRPDTAVARVLLLGYLRWIVAPLVRLVSRDRRVGALAAFLPRSIAEFVAGAALGRELGAAGLRMLEVRSYLRGLVSLCVGVKVRTSGDGSVPGAATSTNGHHGVEAPPERSPMTALRNA
jgi:demethylmenaquinone methyltransferase/2-methoxy-6-polyprenyl-1,4-benzoquinol methylase